MFSELSGDERIDLIWVGNIDMYICILDKLNAI